MTRLFSLLFIIPSLLACNNSADFAKGEIQMISALQDLLEIGDSPNKFIDARKIVTREKIDASGLAVLYVELESGRNGTSIKYPGANIGEVWLGVDGTTITLRNGFLISTRGLGDDLMSSNGDFPALHQVNGSGTYKKTMDWLYADNQIQSDLFTCTISVEMKKHYIIVFDKEFLTRKALETCKSETLSIQNEYFYEPTGVVRRSRQFLSRSLGSIFIERLN